MSAAGLTVLAPCPPDHLEYLSEMLARNAVWLHKARYPDCPGFEHFRHGDHFHIGHDSPHHGNQCKASST